ncbi:MAG: T9SS type A sorting domain-containing protein [Balneolaceae bacterium]|nr:T9SS type A sorting domain-containing protein [Balneolaceae bacterium]
MKSFQASLFGIILISLTITGAYAQDIEPQIAVGRSQSVILTDQGKVYTFGSGSYGSLGQSSLTHNEIATALTHSNLNGYTIIDVAVSNETTRTFALLLADDGTVFGFGDNTYGQLGLGDMVERFEPTPITHDSLAGVKIIDIQAGEDFSVLLSDSGEVFVMGNNHNGYLGIGSTTPSQILVPTKLTHSNLNGYSIAQIATGANHTFLLANNDSLFAFGGNGSGQLGDGSTSTKIEPTLISSSQFGGKQILKMIGGYDSSLFLMADSTVFSWGNHLAGLGQGTLSAAIVNPTQLTHANISGRKFVDISKSEENGFLIDKDGVVFAFGETFYALGLEATSTVLNPTEIDTSYFGGKPIAKLYAAPLHTLFLSEDGTVFSVGDGGDGELGSKYNAISKKVMKVDSTNYAGDRINNVFAGDEVSFLLSNSGKVYSFGGSYSDSTISYLGRTAKRTISRPTLLEHSNISGKTFTKVAAAGERTFLLSDEGKVYAFGLGINGYLGTGDSLNVHVPTLIDHTNIGSKKIVEISTTSNNQSGTGAISHTLLLAEDGTLFGFGDNSTGQLGLGDFNNRMIATEISHPNLSGKTISKIAAGAQNSMLITTDGTVYIWGNGGNGEMGYGNTNNVNVPTEASHVTALGKQFIAGDIGQVSSVGAHFILIASDSSAYAFGENNEGQLGLGNKTDNYTPTKITSANISGKKPIAVSAGIKSTMLLMEDGTVYSFGNTYRVGIEGSRFTDKTEPTLLDNSEILGKKAIAVSSHEEHGLAILDEGTLLSFGSDELTLKRLGALGNGLPESGDETPQPIANFNWLTSPLPSNNLALHLDAGRGFTTSNDSISVWADLSGNDHDATQDNLLRRPVVQDSAINGQTGLRIRSGLNYITLPTAADLGIQNNDYEAFIVAKTRTINSSTAFLMAGSIENFELHINGSAGARFIPNSGNYIDAGSIGDYSDAEAHLYNVEATSTFGKVKVNRSISTIDSSNAHSSYSGNLYLGIRFDNSYQFDGDIAEVIIYNSILSENDRNEVESYLMKKYAIQNYGEVDQSLTGSQGWRFMSSPVADSSYSTLFKGRWTQGMAGASVSNGTPNVYTWSTATATSEASNWNALSDLNTAYTPGSGVLAYVFSDDNGPDVAGDAGFPKTMNVEGIEPQSDQTLTSLLNTNVNGWTLLGNPFKQDVDWDSFTKTNLSNSVYVWDNNSSDWKTWNGSLGDLSDGEIGAFNGFFVQTTGADPTLQVPQAAKTGNKTRFLGKQVQQTQTPWLSLKLNNSELANELWVMFSDEAETGIDNLDALKLQPLSAEYVLLATKTDSVLLDINALPFTENEIRLPLHIESTNSGEHTIQLSGLDMPEGWEISLHDTQLDITTDLSESYSFEIGSKQKRATQEVSLLHTPRLKQVQNDASGDERFVLVITPSSAVANEAIIDLPTVLELSQNYPNPFNPSSVIEFGLPQNALVSLQVFDVLGRKVAELINQQTMEAGYHAIRFDGSSLASGMYIYRLQVADKVLTKKMTLIK